MSLKAFHLLFITLAILMVLGCGAGALRVHLASGATTPLLAAVAAFLSAMVLVAYEVWFVRKARHIAP